ncbi:hypothetical protein EYZ11_006717 [Aspergillus tanneri]|uniref:Restriction of telomere capping protein 4 n=1 Tax=Aspergillus tanneri TaxID=1220188 RepID=A0A4S3JES0_9EURO|nr:hypothetical protein EYZ11_006717 [Aspergillus tanneri]
MVHRSKLDSSHSCTRLTRSGYTGPSLLSNFRKDNGPVKPEPATDDEPISSSEEEKESNPDHTESENESRPRLPTKTLEEKLAESTQRSGKELRSSLSKSSPQKSRGTSRKRTIDAVNKDESDADGDPFSPIRSSQSHKRRRFTAYQSKNSRKADMYGKTPSSSMASRQSESPSAGTRKPKSKSQKSETQSVKEDRVSKEDGFKVPMDINIDVASPVSKPRPEFKQPLPLPNDGISSSSFVTSSTREAQVFDVDSDDSPPSTPLSSADSSILEMLREMDDDILARKEEVGDTTPNEGPLCPMCKAPVDAELLMRFQAQPKQRVRDQQRFCESHKQKSAETEWQKKGYPNIDWDKFDDRIQGHFDELEALLVSESPSYYRNILDTNLKSGKAKNFRLTLAGDGIETISCGYYAASDHIVKKAGVVPYAQAVLVPELAVRLVKEDMGVNDESARQILRDSIDLGEKFNFALDDKVPIPVDEEGIITAE